MIRCLLVGKDARTDCLAEILLRSKRKIEVFAFSEFRIPGNFKKARNLRVGSFSKQVDKVLEYAREVKPDFAVIGPEEPLAIGLVDRLMEEGIPSVGPTKALARLETSKTFTRELFAKYGIDGNPEHRVFRSTNGLDEYLHHLGEFVVKPDGLTGGKGVRIYPEHFHSFDEARAYAIDVVEKDHVVLVEERLDGEEFSIQTLCDGAHFAHFPVAQDHKRAYEGDKGPNTGGMGSYSCEDFELPFLSKELINNAHTINEAVGKALLSETGEEYKGVLYGGFILTKDGIRLLEYNARFADPESMNVLPILETDFVDVCEAVINGKLDTIPLTFNRKATVCKYLVPENYPVQPTPPNSEILVPAELSGRDDLRLYYAAVTEKDDGKIYLTNSRSLAVVGIGNSLPEAEIIAEEAAKKVKGKIRHRRDIGTRKLIDHRVAHMRQILHWLNKSEAC